MLDVQEISDRIEIQDLLARYTQAIDQRDWDALDRVFTPDAYIDYSAMGGESGGVSEIKDFLARVMPMFESTQHLLGSSVVDIDGDTANARTICHNPMVLRGGDDPHLLVCGLWYRDKLVRTPAGWRISERVEERSYIKEEPPCPK